MNIVNVKLLHLKGPML